METTDMALAPHIAAEDEEIPPIGERPWDGPDMRTVMPIEDMLLSLREFNEDVVGYLQLWRAHLASMGGSVSLNYERDGTRHLMVGSGCDAQARHRSRWLHFLCEDLKEVDERYSMLMDLLEEKGHYSDNRLNNPRETTSAIRGYLLASGRILIDPQGKLTESGGVPRQFLGGIEEEAAQCVRATREYHRVRRRWRSEAQIKRAVRLLGKPAPNGGTVLQAKKGAT